MSAVVSPPPAHLFGNHDNQTGSGHDGQLDDASRSGGDFTLEAAIEEGFRARKWPSHQGKEGLLDEF